MPLCGPKERCGDTTDRSDRKVIVKVSGKASYVGAETFVCERGDGLESFLVFD